MCYALDKSLACEVEYDAVLLEATDSLYMPCRVLFALAVMLSLVVVKLFSVEKH